MLRVIPTRAQWSGWSLPSKLTCIGTYAGVLSIILAIVFSLWPVSSTRSSATKTPAKGGSVSVQGIVRAGDGHQAPGGDAMIKAGDGSNGMSGGDITIGPGIYKAGDGGSSGKGGDLVIKAGDAK
jgi:hypothetical protein